MPELKKGKGWIRPRARNTALAWAYRENLEEPSEELCLFWQKILSCFIHRPCIARAGLVTIQTRQEANIVNKDARLRDGARPMAAECGQTANQRSLRGPDTAVMAAIKFEFVLIPAISPGSDYHLCIRSQHKSLADPVKTRSSQKHKHQGSEAPMLVSWWQRRVADYAEAAVISFMTTQMAPDLVEICFDLETKSEEARFRLGEAIKANDPLGSNGIRNRAGRFTMHPAV